MIACKVARARPHRGGSSRKGALKYGSASRNAVEVTFGG